MLAGLVCHLVGVSLASIPFPRVKRYLFLFPACGSALLAGFALFLIYGIPLQLTPIRLSPFFEFSFAGDALSGLFLLAICILTGAVSVFSVGYVRDMDRKGFMITFFTLFVLGMNAVVLSANVITFLVSWETMSVASYFLVTTSRDEKSTGAGLVYAVMTHIGTAFITVLFLVIASYTGQMDFSAMKALSAEIPGSVRNALFVFCLIGFGTKAGIIPLHTWLPRAHPAAPSNISALMSGVMIKTGVYGIVRVAIDILGQGPEWWGITVLAIGAVSAVYGILYAFMETDLKRLLAFSSIENIGIILLGLGAAMVLRTHGLYTLSAIALIAALLHTLNHSIFKGLLFLGAGAVVHATHTRDMERMGGLLKTLPATGLFFLIGALAACAFPPLNGFVSEWLTFQALLGGFEAPSTAVKIISPLGGAALALTGALAAGAFVKAFGISFLGNPRMQCVPHQGTDSFMTAGMGFLALLCFAMGIFPGFVLGLVSPSAYMITGSYGLFTAYGFLSPGGISGSLSPLMIFLGLAVMFISTLLFVRLVGGRGKTVVGDSWDCGIPALTSRMQYTATAFSKPVRLIFRRIYLPRRALRVSYLQKPFFVSAIRYRGEITPFFERYLYDPLTRFIRSVASRVRLVQSGSLHLYLAYILITLILLLIFGA